MNQECFPQHIVYIQHITTHIHKHTHTYTHIHKQIHLACLRLYSVIGSSGYTYTLPAHRCVEVTTVLPAFAGRTPPPPHAVEPSVHLCVCESVSL